jgi:alkane 1-monooxygenase
MKYLLAYSLPLIAFLGILFGGFWTYFGVVFAFGILPVLEFILPTNEKNYTEAEIENKLKNHFFDVLLYLNIFIVYGMLFFVLHKVSTEQLSMTEIIGAVLSLGVVLGSNGINVAHELGHREKLYERIIGKLLLIPSHYTHFFIEHNHGHHLHVSTPEDPSTAKYNQTLYEFWIQTVFGTYTKAWKIQKKLNQLENRSLFSLKNDMFWFTIIQISYLLDFEKVNIYFL